MASPPQSNGQRNLGSRFPVPRSRPSQSPYATRDFIELWMPVRLVVARIEQWTRVAGRRCDDRRRRDHPEAHDLAAPSVDVTRVLHRVLGGGGVHAARML